MASGPPFHLLHFVKDVALSPMRAEKLLVITILINHMVEPPHKQLRQWFEQQFYHFPSQSTISESLSSTFAHLDNKV